MNRPAAFILYPREAPSKTFTEIVRIIDYKFDEKHDCYVFKMCTKLGHYLTLHKPNNPYYPTNKELKFEKNYYWKVVYSGDSGTYGEIQVLKKQGWMFPHFMMQFSI
jgi:hypothetical protein